MLVHTDRDIAWAKGSTPRARHVQGVRGEAKFWIEPQVELAQDYGLGPQMVNRALRLIRELK